jgi:hypothetical protein
MTAHDHAVYTPGCYRCDLSEHEERTRLDRIDAEVVAAEANRARYVVVAAARAFVEWHVSQPSTSNMIGGMTLADELRWNTEWDKRLAVLVEAVQGMTQESPISRDSEGSTK